MTTSPDDDAIAAAAAEKRAAEMKAASEKWQRNKYSIYTDISLGALFFIIAKVTDHLATAAVITAIAGLGVVVAQRFVKVDLLGGLAMFGVAMLLVSAGFSLVFDDDSIVKMKSTYLGLLVASLMFSDAVFNRGGYFGRRLARYMPSPVSTQRLAFGMATLGLVMAGLNYFVAEHFSTDIWLYYTSAGDFIGAAIAVGDCEDEAEARAFRDAAHAAGIACNRPAFFGRFFIFRKPLSILTSGNLCCRKLAKHCEYQFSIAHVITQVVLLL